MDLRGSTQLYSLMNHKVKDLLPSLEARYGKGKVTASFLRQELALRNNQASYEFDFDGKKSPKASERLLAAQDIFIVTALSLHLLKEEDGKEGSGVLLTHVDSAVFVAAAGFVPAHLETLYNGAIQCKMGNTTVFEALQTKNFRKVPAEFIQRDGSVDIDPNIVLFGKEKNKLILTIPSFAGINIASVAAGVSHKVVLMPEGFLVTGHN